MSKRFTYYSLIILQIIFSLIKKRRAKPSGREKAKKIFVSLKKKESSYSRQKLVLVKLFRGKKFIFLQKIFRERSF
jgi:hypothetical protein